MNNPVLCFGEILLRIEPSRGKRLRQSLPGDLRATFTGAEANVAFALAQLGTAARFLGAVPENDPGRAVASALQVAGVDATFLVPKPVGRLGLFYYEPAADPRPGRVTYDREGSAAALSGPEDYPMEAALDGVAWVHLSGITPAISRAAFESCVALAKLARQRGIPVSLDLNLRLQLWRWSPDEPPQDLLLRCLQTLMSHVTVLLASDGQAAEVFQMEACLEGDNRIAEAARLMRAIAERYPALSTIAFSHRETVSPEHTRMGGLLFDTTSRDLHFAPTLGDGSFAPHDILRISDRLGTGDAFAAGLIHSLLTPEPGGLVGAIAFAAACGTLAHSIEGDFNWIDSDDVRSFLSGSAHRGILR